MEGFSPVWVQREMQKTPPGGCMQNTAWRVRLWAKCPASLTSHGPFQLHERPPIKPVRPPELHSTTGTRAGRHAGGAACETQPWTTDTSPGTPTLYVGTAPPPQLGHPLPFRPTASKYECTTTWHGALLCARWGKRIGDAPPPCPTTPPRRGQLAEGQPAPPPPMPRHPGCFTVVFLVIEAHGGRCFRTPCPIVVRSRSKC